MFQHLFLETVQEDKKTFPELNLLRLLPWL